MNRYQLFPEWRGKTIIGNSLSDALKRVGKLQRPDKFEKGQLVEHGGEVRINRVVHEVDTSDYLRGSIPFESALVEPETGECVEVDAQVDVIPIRK